MTDAVDRLNAALEGRYRVARELGEGGMATVYLADDLRHDRQVALKVLKPELAAVMGAERFLAEIKTTANLQHPHILPLHDSGEADGFLFYVMPFIEGETLRDRLDREKQLPVDEAVRIATDVAEALDAAHRQGVIHRDVKPANILMSSGRPLVADFGIALAVSAAGGGRLTETGLSMGTPYYMSPEQAAADREPTPASDVYSLGCVLYEMLVGDPPHTGSSAQAVLAKILTEEAPDATKTRAAIPANVDAALRKALQKLPADRFPGAEEFVRALADPAFGADARAATAAAAAPDIWKPMALAASALSIVLGGALVWSLLRPSPPQPVSRYSIVLPEAPANTFVGEVFTLAPDGSAIFFAGVGETGERQLYLRPRDQLVATPLAGTGGGRNPAISPDGRRFAFVDAAAAPRRLLAGSFGGGPPVALTDSLVDNGGVAFGYDGFIYYDGHLEGDGIARIAEGGGSPQVVTMPRPEDGERYHIQPQPLPDGRGLLITIARDDQWAIGVADLATGEHRTLATGAIGARYSPTGHVLYVADDGTLIARAFDSDALEFTGEPVAMFGGVLTSGLGRSDVALSPDGTLLYRSGGEGRTWDLVWVSREGAVTPIDPGWSGLNFWTPAVSPDDTQLSVSVLAADAGEIWVKRLDRLDVPARLFANNSRGATWTGGGATLHYVSLAEGGVHVRPADGSAPAEAVFGRGYRLWSLTFSDDDSLVAWMGNGDVFAGALDSIRGLEGLPAPLLSSPAGEIETDLSPDGRWLAYASNTSGGFEVYVCPMPACDVQHRVSTSGGSSPRWAADASRLFYIDDDASTMMEAEVVDEGRFQRGAVRSLFDVSQMRTGGAAGTYDVSSDGQRFLMLQLAEAEQASEIIIIENFFEELKARVPN